MCSLARWLGSLQIRTRASAEMFDLGTEEGAVGGSLQAVDRPVSLFTVSGTVECYGEGSRKKQQGDNEEMGSQLTLLSGVLFGFST